MQKTLQKACSGTRDHLIGFTDNNKGLTLDIWLVRLWLEGLIIATNGLEFLGLEDMAQEYKACIEVYRRYDLVIAVWYILSVMIQRSAGSPQWHATSARSR